MLAVKLKMTMKDELDLKLEVKVVPGMATVLVNVSNMDST